MSPLIAEVAAYIARHDLITQDDRVLVGLSGGPDSVVLLHVLNRLGYTVEAAHLDHGLRPGSAADARWVEARCAEWGVPFHGGVARVTPAGSIEAAAREARYAYLSEVARARGCTLIALGHHADDQAETLLFRLARGTGPSGLAGMRPRREQGAGPAIVRPLLGVSRPAIEAALAAWGLPSLTDPSNADTDFARNRLRHVVMPALRAISPDATRHVARLAELMAEEEALGEEETARLAKYMTRTFSSGMGEVDRRALGALPPPRRRRVLRHLAARLGAPAWDAASLDALCRVSASGGAVDLAGGWRAWVEDGVLVLGGNLPGPAPVSFLQVPTQPTAPWGWRVTWRPTVSDAPASPVCVRFDAGELPEGLVWRSGKPDDDGFQPWGHRETHSLRHFLARAGVPRRHQGHWLVLAHEETVYWVVGVRRGSRARVQRTPENVWEMQAAAGFWV